MQMQWRWTFLVLALAATVGGACAVKDTLYCETDQDCADNPGRPYCDVTGVWPQSEGIGKTCIGSPFDAGIPDAGIPDAGDPDAMLTWSPFEVVGVIVDGSANAPSTSDDGLNLYFTYYKQGVGSLAIYRAVRGSATEPFGTAILLFSNARYPEVSADGLELYFTRDSDGELMVSSRPSLTSPFGTPTIVGTPGSFPSISGDKRSLYFIATTTGTNGELRRMSRLAVGQPWSTPVTVPLSGAVEIYSSIDISRDQLAILRAPTFANGGTVVIERRASETAAFGSPEMLPSANYSGVAYHTARWSANDTQVWIEEASSNVSRPAVSRLR